MKPSVPTSFSFISATILCSLLALTGCSTQYATDKTSAVDTEYDDYYGLPYRGNRQHFGASSSISSNPIRQGAPTRYTVKKGDTLWDISRMFLKQPGYWPEIWDKNQSIKNPHRIYPGDVLYIHYGKGTGTSGETVKLSPSIRVERNGRGEPISVFEPFLTWPRIVDKDDLTSAPYIVAAKDAAILIENDKTVYAKGISHSQRGDTYAIYHAIKEINDPDTQELIGTQIDYHGLLTVTQPNTITSTIVESSDREIRRGDRLIRVEDKPTDFDIEMRLPTTKVRGTIMSLYDAELIVGQRMIAIINRGSRDGIRAGHVLGVYTSPRLADDPYEKRYGKLHSVQPVAVKLPPERVGTMVVYDVNDRYSYALVTKSDNAVKVGQKIGNP